jgi:hypothetical protein
VHSDLAPRRLNDRGRSCHLAPLLSKAQVRIERGATSAFGDAGAHRVHFAKIQPAIDAPRAAARKPYRCTSP